MPLGFVVSQLERAGFEVGTVQNHGTHYGRTIKQWYNNWVSNEDQILEKYGQRWFNMWCVFLSWSSLIANQGSSTVFMITNAINHKNDEESVSHAYPKCNRTRRANYKCQYPGVPFLNN